MLDLVVMSVEAFGLARGSWTVSLQVCWLDLPVPLAEICVQGVTGCP